MGCHGSLMVCQEQLQEDLQHAELDVKVRLVEDRLLRWHHTDFTIPQSTQGWS